MYKTFKRSNVQTFKRCLVAVIVASYACLSMAGVVGAQEATNLKVNRIDGLSWPDVTVNMTLTGPDGKAIADVNPSQFQVFEQGKEQAVTGLELAPARSVPLALALTLDVSGSMNADNKFNQAKTALNTFINSLRPEDTAALIAFSDIPTVIVKPTNDRGVLQAAVNALQASGNTAVYDALQSSAKEVSTAKPEQRRAIILLTDGTDTSSKISSVVAAQTAKETGAFVYTIGLGPDPNDAVLKDLAELSGGKYYKAPSPDDLINIYNSISIELDSQLYLNYKSNAQMTRSYELVPIEVRYTAPDGRVYSAKVSYRPPPIAVPTATEEPQIVRTPGATVTPLGANSGPNNATPPASTGIAEQAGMYSLGAALLAGVAALFGMMAFANVFVPSQVSQRVASYVAGAPLLSTEDVKPGFFSRVIAPFFDSIGKRLAKLSPRGYTDHIQELLTLTGPPYRMQTSGFLAIQLVSNLIVVFVFLLWSLRTSPDAPTQWVLAIVLGVVVGTYFPYFWLKRRVARRRRALLRALPGALDFLAINVEAGLGFDAALGQVVQRWHNTLTDEFALLMIDFQIGKHRKEAWRDLVQRTQLPELTSFITAMLQNEQVGASIGNLLRTQAEQMRIRRRQQAEEAARKAPVKMLFPLVFFILPGLFVVIIGPAIPQFMGSFLSSGK